MSGRVDERTPQENWPARMKENLRRGTRREASKLGSLSFINWSALEMESHLTVHQVACEIEQRC
jgi:hypothetical protein